MKESHERYFAHKRIAKSNNLKNQAGAYTNWMLNMKKQELRELIEAQGQRYSEILSINLSQSEEKEVFKWFLASILFGAPITEASAIKTYKCFKKHNVLTPDKILKTGWQGLVNILDEGRYTRYDYKTADKLLEVMNNLKTQYKGNLNELHKQAASPLDLEKRIKTLGKGIGDVTVSIFLRELRGIWSKADPKPTPLVVQAAKNLKIVRNDDSEKAKNELIRFWNKNQIKGASFINFETALLRLGKDMRRKRKSVPTLTSSSS